MTTADTFDIKHAALKEYQANALVTGNLKHFVFLPKLGVPVLSPAECLKKLI